MNWKLSDVDKELTYEINFNKLKFILNSEGEKPFYLEWLDEETFIISLHFSLGTNYFFPELHPKAKSRIISKGTLLNPKENNSQKIRLQIKQQRGFYLILVLPIIIVAFNWIMDIPPPVYIFALGPIFAYFFFKILIESEQKKLLSNFKQYLDERVSVEI